MEELVFQVAASLFCGCFLMYKEITTIKQYFQPISRMLQTACFQLSLQSSYVIYVAYLSLSIRNWSLWDFKKHFKPSRINYIFSVHHTLIQERNTQK